MTITTRITFLEVLLLTLPFLASLSSPAAITTSMKEDPGEKTERNDSTSGCASPEVLVNGSPSPDILETVNGGHSSSSLGSIQEIQFVGVVGGGKEKRRRICRIKCLNGVWVGPLCTLEPECPILESNDRHLVMSVEGSRVNDRIHFSCSEGFSLEGQSRESVCNPNGSWSHPPPNCRANICPEVETDDPQVRIEVSSRNPGGEAHFSCPPGFKVTGPSSSFCLSNGSWSEPSRRVGCEVVTCPPPVAPVNGSFIDLGHFKVGDFVEYFCNPGFLQVGNPLSYCLQNGSWSLPGPDCKAVCDFPGEPENGYVVPTKFHYNIGEGISLVCKESYHPIGPAFVYCNSEGKWSSPLPDCRQRNDDSS